MLFKINLVKQLAASIIISTILSVTACASMHTNSGDDLELLQEKIFNITPGNKLIVELSSGDVKVTYWDKSEVYVKIFGNDNAINKMDFNMNGNDEVVEVRGEKKSSVSSWFSNINVEVEIKVPSQFNLDINTAGGDIRCGGIKGIAQLNTSGGDIWADKFSGNLNASTSGGDIYLFCSDALIEAETSGGDVKLEYTGENKGIELSTSGGDIEIKLPENFKASIDLSTSGGDVSCSMNMSNIKKSYSSSLKGDLNGGGKKLIAQTSGGDVTVGKK